MPASDSISGIAAVDRALKKFETKIRQKVVKKATRKATVLFRKEVRKNTPVGKTGRLRKSVTSRVKSRKRGMFYFGSVYHGRSGNRKGHHAVLVEFGTKNRVIKDWQGWLRSGRTSVATQVSVGGTKKQEMATRAWNAKKGKAIKIYRRALVQELRKVRAKG